MEGSNKLIRLIPKGEANAISMHTLSVYLDCSERETRRIIKYARLAGKVICGDSSGYYLPETVAELRAYYHLAKERAATSRKCLKAVCRALEIEGEHLDE